MRHSFRARLIKFAAITRVAADRNWGDGDPKAPRTPWGQAQDEYKIVPGVSFFHTAGHGGLRVSPAVARKMLSHAAMKNGDFWGGAFWYEEDVAVSIPFYEHPEWGKELARKAGGRVGTKEEYERVFRRYFPQYLKMKSEGFVLPSPVRMGDRLRVVKPLNFRSGITLNEGDIVVVVQVTRARVLFEDGQGRRFAVRLQDYYNGDLVKIP